MIQRLETYPQASSFESRSKSKDNPVRKGERARNGSVASHSGSGDNRGFTRRQLLIAGALAAVGVVVLDRARETAVASPYDHWERFRNGEVPSDITVAVGQDLAKNTEYPGFSDVGAIITMAQQDPQELRKYFPILATRVPLSLTGGNDNFMQPKFDNTQGELLRVHDKVSGNDFQKSFVESDKLELSVHVDSGLYLAPENVKKLVVVKEFSHILYLQAIADSVSTQVGQRYSVERPNSVTDLSTFFFVNSDNFGGETGYQLLGYRFNHASVDVDGAGYWHIMRAFGKMKEKGELSQTDLKYLSSVNTTFDIARTGGLIEEVHPTDFRWKDGITPLSLDWTQITRAILSNKSG